MSTPTTGRGHRMQTGAVALYCANGHEHRMGPEQALRLHGETCWICKTPYTDINLEWLYPYERGRIDEQFPKHLFRMEKLPTLNADQPLGSVRYQTARSAALANSSTHA